MDGNNNQFGQENRQSVYFGADSGQGNEQSVYFGAGSGQVNPQYENSQNVNQGSGNQQYYDPRYGTPQYSFPPYGFGIPQPPVFNERKAKSHFSRIGLSYFIFWLVAIVLGNFIAVVMYLSFPEAMDNYFVSMMVALLPMYLVGAPLCMLCINNVEREKPRRNHWSFWQIVGGFIVGYSLMYLGSWIGSYIGLLIESVLPDAQASTNNVQEMVLTGEMWVNVIAMVLIGPVVEELLFRKLLCDRLKVYGDWVTIIVTGIMFGAFHGNITQGIYACMFGMFLAYVYLRTGNIFITIGYHVTANFMGSVLPLLLLNSSAVEGLEEVLEGGDVYAVSDFVSEHPEAFLMYGGYILLVFGLMLAGIVIMIVTVARGHVVINRGRYSIPSGKRFTTIFVNVGMILFLIGCFAEVIINTFC